MQKCRSRRKGSGTHGVGHREEREMNRRIDYTQAAPGVFQAMLQLERQVRASGLEPALLELVRLRASQLNGCAYCVAMHHREARAAGEGEERLSMVVVWQESPLFSPRERSEEHTSELQSRGHLVCRL